MIDKRLEETDPMDSSGEDFAFMPGAGDESGEGEPSGDATVQMNDDGSAEITYGDSDGYSPAPAFDANLAEFMDDNDLLTVASDIISQVEADIDSRKDWVEAYIKGLDVLGMKYEKRTEPWDDACGVYSTLLTEAAVRFQSEMITETFPAQGPVKTLIIGDSTPEKEQAADRVKEDMNYQLTEVMVEYRPEHERLLFNLGLSGSAFKKVYQDDALGRQVSMFIPAEDMIIPYGTSNIYVAERATHVMRKTKNDLRKLQVSEFYRDIDIGDPLPVATDVEKKKAEEQGYKITDDDRYQIYETVIDYNLPGFEDEDGIALPYVISIERGTQKVLSIRRNWDEADQKRQRKQHFVQYTYIPGFGAYGIGLINLIGGYAKGATQILRQLVDAGTLANLPGGLKAKGLRIKGGDEPIGPGQWKDVDLASGSIRDNILPLPYKEPSQTLHELLNDIAEEARRLAAISDMNISDMSAQAPVGTTLAILERTLKTMSAVQARVHASLRMEFKLLKQIIRDNAPTSYDFEVDDGQQGAKAQDYDLVDVIPVSDPNAATMAQRIMQYQAATQLSSQAPQVYNIPYLHRQMIEVLGLKNADKIVPIDEDQPPRDPVSENMGLLTGKPAKAFILQDHDAHNACHMALLRDPMIMQVIGQGPMAQQVVGSIMSHISEHIAFSYRAKMEQQMGVPLPPPDAPLPPDQEAQLSRLTAQAAQQLLQQNMSAAQQQAAQAAAMNPELQLKSREVAVKEKESERKQQEMLLDNKIARGKLVLEAAKIDATKKQGTAGTVTQLHATERQHQQHQDKMMLEHKKVNQQAQQQRMQMTQQAQINRENNAHQTQQNREKSATSVAMQHQANEAKAKTDSNKGAKK